MSEDFNYIDFDVDAFIRRMKKEELQNRKTFLLIRRELKKMVKNHENNN